MPLGAALELTLRQWDLTLLVHHGVALVTTMSQAETMMESVIYPVEDLLFPPPELRIAGRKYPPDYDSLIELVTSAISPTTWSEGNSSGGWRYHGALIIPQTQDVHAEIADLFNQLRAVRLAQFPPAVKEPPAARRTVTRERAEAIHAALRKPIELNLADADLAELARQISKHCGISVMLDNKAFEEAGIEPEKLRFTRRLAKISLAGGLDLLLDGHHLSWAVQDGVLLITSQSMSETIIETRVYPIRGLGTAPRPNPSRRMIEEYETLLELITAEIQPTSWSEVGGVGAVKVVPNAAALVVSQVTSVHVELEQFLAGLRTFRAEHPGDPADAANARPAADEFVVFAYHIPSGYGWDTQPAPAPKPDEKKAAATGVDAQMGGTYISPGVNVPPSLATRERIAQQLAVAIRKLVEPESWGAGKDQGSIEIVSDVLYIRQRMAIHEKVASLLDPTVIWPMYGGMGGGIGFGIGSGMGRGMGGGMY